MDQVNAALNANLNLLVAFSLLALSIALLVLVGIASSLWMQANRTLYAFEKLADTVTTELQPTLSEASKLIGGVLKLQDIAQNSVSNVSGKVEDMSENINKAADDATRGSRVIGAGVLAGIRAYLKATDEQE